MTPTRMTTCSIPSRYKEPSNIVFHGAASSRQHAVMPATVQGGKGKFNNSEPGNGRSADEYTRHDDRQLLEALSRSKLYRDYERTFTEATGLPLGLRPVQFFGLPFHGKRNENPFCAFLAERKSCCALCLKTQARVAEAGGENAHTVQCPYGLAETAVPILLGKRVVGFLCTGQVFTHSPKLDARKAREIRLSFDAAGIPREALHLWKRTRSMDLAKYKATVHLLGFFAKQLSALSNQLFIEQKPDEPLVVTRARQFIAANKRGRITLAAVAQASGSSMFHFCKLFRTTTGVKFTEYVARTRVEEARDLLRDRRMRMCEVAYEAGFQSLTAFHRAFQRILGQSPTEYRSAMSPSRR